LTTLISIVRFLPISFTSTSSEGVGAVGWGWYIVATPRLVIYND